MKSRILKSAFFSVFVTAAIALTPVPAFALDLFNGGLGGAMNGQIGVSTHINNTPVYEPFGAHIPDRNRQIYIRDAQERTARQRGGTAVFQDLSLAPAQIAPAAGVYKKPLPAYDMGGIHGGHSYND